MRTYTPTPKKLHKRRRQTKLRRRPASPHDHFFRYVFAQVDHARDMLRLLVGEQTARLFDWSTLKLEPGSYIDERLRASMSDLLFSLRFRDSSHRGLVYLVWDHQRNPNVYMPLRMLNYSGRALRDYTRSYGAVHGYLPPIIPVLVYQGPGRWPGPIRLSDLHHIPGEIVPPVFVELHMVVHELDHGSIPLDELTVLARNALRVLRAAALGALVIEHAKRISEWVKEVHGNSQDDDFEAIVEYILQATKDRELMRNIYRYVSETKADGTMSGADWLRADGKAEGMVEGRVEGAAQLLLRILGQRFGELPRDVGARVRGGTLPELERWASRLLLAGSLEAIFAVPEVPPPAS